MPVREAHSSQPVSPATCRGHEYERPLVGVSCCKREISGAFFHTVLDKYLVAVTDYADCDVVLLPALGDRHLGGRLDSQQILKRLDGIVLTGSRTMIEPSQYGGDCSSFGTSHDLARDSTTLPLARYAVASAVPILAICRGFQELCCAYGSSLEQNLADRGDRLDHRAPENAEYGDRYLPKHRVQCVAGRKLSSIASAVDMPDLFEVNSLHVQGVDSLGPALAVEARADDGLVEAVSVINSSTFALGVQWHPEWYIESNPVNYSIFKSFGAACLHRSLARAAGGSKDSR